MVRLKNIQIKNDYITCQIFPEDSKNPGYISVDKRTGDAEYTLPVGYEYCGSHVRHARNRLIELLKAGEEKKEMLIMWY